MTAFLEHVNLTVAEPEATAAMLGRLFGWQVRWQGGAIHGGRSVHVGTPGQAGGQYLALYRGAGAQAAPADSYGMRAGLNHIAVVVDDLDATEARAAAEGFAPMNHADYEPGRRFYFRDGDGVEYEVVSYA